MRDDVSREMLGQGGKGFIPFHSVSFLIELTTAI